MLVHLSFCSVRSLVGLPATSFITHLEGNALNELIRELKFKIIESLNLIDLSPEDINENAQFIGGDLGLDSIDVLELVMMLEKDYGVEIDSKELGVKVFASVFALAEYIDQNRKV